MLIEIDQIHKSFELNHGLFSKPRQQVLKGVSCKIFSGECVGLVGESGSGKSTLGRVIIGLEQADSGKVYYSESLNRLPKQQAISVVFQDYHSAVNPRLTVAQSIAEPLLRSHITREERNQLVTQLLQEVGLAADIASRYPHQLSGGQLQRVCIARAIAPNPKFILFDEAVSSLDVSIQVQILDLLLALKQQRQLTYLFITHDIAVATYICDRLLFFKQGELVEQIDDLSKLSQVKHNYTQQLLAATSYLEPSYMTEDL